MRKLILLSVFFGFYLIGHASDVRSVTSTPGQLGTLTSAYQSTVTDLTITGTMDARDFVIIRDLMPNLVSVNLSGVTIAAYTGPKGTDAPWNLGSPLGYRGPNGMDSIWETGSIVYSANELPIYAFSLDYYDIPSSKITNLTTIILPNNLTSIADGAFEQAKITSLIIPSSVTKIGSAIIMLCESLPSITIPSSVTTFSGVPFYRSYFTSITVPSSVTTFKGLASYSQLLTTINLPSTITSIGYDAFAGLPSLTTFNSAATTPPTIDPTAFTNSSAPASIKLNVPASSVGAYSIAPTWNKFFSMYVSIPIITPIPFNVFNTISGTASSSKKFQIYPSINLVDVTITAPSGFELRESGIGVWGNYVTLSSPTGSIPITEMEIRIASNTSVGSITGDIVCSSTLCPSQNIPVSGTVSDLTQTINSTNGQLATLTNAYQAGVTDLTITGTMDARDFVTIRDQMPNLVSLDLSGVTIVAYNTGNQGTKVKSQTTSLANELPQYAFALDNSNKFINLSSVILPNNLTSIGNSAFRNTKIASLTIPAPVNTIGQSAFANSSFKSITIPSGVTSIPDSMIMNSKLLTSINLPSSITSIGISAFAGLPSLTTVNCAAIIPPTIDPTAFVGTPITNVKVYVPTASDYYTNVNWVSNFPDKEIQQQITTPIPTIELNKTNVFYAQQKIIIDGTLSGDRVTIYNMTSQLYSALSNGERIAFQVEQHGVYIVKSNDKTVKLLL